MHAENIQLLPQWTLPASDKLPKSVDEFLKMLVQPCYILITGRDTSRTRAVCTLLHGNEPSGVRAIHHYLHQGIQPEVNIVCIIASINAALTSPVFSYRMLPGQKDLNRCFNPPYENDISKLAHTILQTLQYYEPECLVDIHNTSGAGPAFAVSVSLSERHKSLTALFASEMIFTDIKLGSLMEQGDKLCPTVTIECGGANDPRADRIAIVGMERYFNVESAVHYPSDEINVYRHPVRVELVSGCQVCYSDAITAKADINLPISVELFNERVVQSGELIGWVGDKGISSLTAIDGQGQNIIDKLFFVKGSDLYAACALKIFMATTNPSIAETDCLFYVAEPDHM